MSYVMNHNVRDGIPTFELHGTKSVENSREIWSRLQAHIETNKLGRLLVIDEMIDDLTVWDVVDIETFLTVADFARGVRVAIVDRALRNERNSNAFGELYLLNRGWYRIKMFENRDLALAWLRSDEGEERAEVSLDAV
jgi:hypothetical protein